MPTIYRCAVRPLYTMNSGKDAEFIDGPDEECRHGYGYTPESAARAAQSIVDHLRIDQRKHHRYSRDEPTDWQAVEARWAERVVSPVCAECGSDHGVHPDGGPICDDYDAHEALICARCALDIFGPRVSGPVKTTGLQAKESEVGR